MWRMLSRQHSTINQILEPAPELVISEIMRVAKIPLRPKYATAKQPEWCPSIKHRIQQNQVDIVQPCCAGTKWNLIHGIVMQY